ncbi:MAG: hypothetical protein ABIO36_01490 [Pyrinomonadaceae bacterium]
MVSHISRSFFCVVILVTGCVYCSAQVGEDKDPSFSKIGGDRNDKPRGFKETLEKMRIDKEKRDFDQMIERGGEALKISEEVDKSFEANGRLSEKEKAKLSEVEKLVKKIRNELGGDDDAETDDKDQPQGRFNSPSLADAVKTLRSASVDLYNELQKTTRFTISAAAIQSSNAVLRLARFLRISNR